MKESFKSFLGIMLVAAVAFLLGSGYGRKTAKKPVDLRVIWDTTEVIKYDTIVRERPVYVASYVYDTVRTHFTTIQHDTVLVNVPMERRVYEEDSLYRAVVTGWNPVLESLTIYPTVTTVTIREKIKTPAPRFSFGVTAGPSVLATPQGRVHAGLGVTAGLNYRF